MQSELELTYPAYTRKLLVWTYVHACHSDSQSSRVSASLSMQCFLVPKCYPGFGLDLISPVVAAELQQWVLP